MATLRLWELVTVRILLSPLGSPGFAFPAIAITRELRRRGHNVCFWSSSWLGSFVDSQASGIPTRASGANDPFQTSTWHQPAAVEQQVRDLEVVVQQFKPDVLVTSALALGPLIVGERAQIPVVVIGLLTGLLPEVGPRRGEFQRALDECRARVGHSPVSVDRMLGDLYLTRGVPELVDGPNPIGACSWEPAAPRAVVDWLRTADQAGKRVVYVQQARSFGAPGFWPLLASALPPDVVIAASTGRQDQPVLDVRPGALLGAVLPHATILERAVAVICSGTTSVVVDALALGVPIVAVPGGGEQLEVAALVELAGLGVALPARSADAGSLAEALARALALDPGPRDRMRRAFAEMDGSTRAAAWIEAL